MKTKLITFLLILGGAVSLPSCINVDEKGNYQVLMSYAVVNYNVNMGGLTMLIPNYELGAPELSQSELSMDDCIAARFTVDYSNQPYSYLIATQITYNEIAQSYPVVEDELTVDDYKFPVTGIFPSYNLYFKGKVFFDISHTAPSNQKVSYKMICINKEGEDAEVKDVYLLAKSDNDAGSSTNTLTNAYVFDMNNLIRLYGKDTVLEGSTNTSVKRLKFNLKYYTGEKDGIPQFSNVSVSGSGNQLSIDILN
ncbi:MAG: hypothetical protein LBH32_15175 [Dysgonamonadaceae bacterium]|jgi:hypothetical protein|nr:hypothetical protein [Dysgonamonadaceae bacterium]